MINSKSKLKLLESGRKVSKATLAVFWALIIISLLIIGQFFVPLVRDLFSGSLFFLAPFVVFSILGLALIILVLREKPEKKLRRLLLLTGISSAGFFISIFLHNMFYALGLMVDQIPLLISLMEFLSASFFIIALAVCPLAFIIGALGTIILLIKAGKNI